MSERNVRIVLVGPGLIGSRHAALLAESTCADLVAVVAPDRGNNKQFAQVRHVPFFADLSDCLREVVTDGVIIASPNEFHFPQAVACVRAGVPMMIEKPITSTFDAAKELLSLAAAENAKILVGHHRHHSPLLAVAESVVAAGHLGRIVSFTGSAQFHKPQQYFLDGPWRTKIGGGPILINLIHEIGIWRVLVGAIDEVHAYSSSMIRGLEVEDTVAISFRSVSGVLGTFMMSDCASTPASWEQTSEENLAYPTYPDVDCYMISGTKGSLHFPTMRVFSYSDQNSASWWEPFIVSASRPHRLDPLEAQLQHFIDVIRGIDSPRISAFDGVENLRVLEAVRLSVAQNRAVKLEEVD